jgi:hypothetical protein
LLPNVFCLFEAIQLVIRHLVGKYGLGLGKKSLALNIFNSTSKYCADFILANYCNRNHNFKVGCISHFQEGVNHCFGHSLKIKTLTLKWDAFETC